MRSVKRYEDMSRHGNLEVLILDDGDVIVQITNDPESPCPGFAFAEFCLPMSGGGQSEHTRLALVNLFNAMREDNEERPQSRGGPDEEGAS